MTTASNYRHQRISNRPNDTFIDVFTNLAARYVRVHSGRLDISVANVNLSLRPDAALELANAIVDALEAHTAPAHIATAANPRLVVHGAHSARSEH